MLYRPPLTIRAMSDCLLPCCRSWNKARCSIGSTSVCRPTPYQTGTHSKCTFLPEMPVSGRVGQAALGIVTVQWCIDLWTGYRNRDDYAANDGYFIDYKAVPGTVRLRVDGLISETKLREVSDGLSNTLLLWESIGDKLRTQYGIMDTDSMAPQAFNTPLATRESQFSPLRRHPLNLTP